MGEDCGSKLQNYLEQLRSIRQKGTLEDSVRDAFLYFLREAFPRPQLAEPFELEKCVLALRVHGGFADALYDDLIFEFKCRLDDNACTDGKEQLKHYLPNQPRPDRYFGILTDGENLEVYALRDCEKRLVPTANDLAYRAICPHSCIRSAPMQSVARFLDELALARVTQDAAGSYLGCLLVNRRRIGNYSLNGLGSSAI